MFGECHAHIMMDGKNYRGAVERHREGVREDWIRECFREYRKREITFVRDGGDAMGVSQYAKKLAPEYGIDYRTPVFAIHREGCYGKIVGRAYRDMQEYYRLVLEAKRCGADFIKIMTTGILDFQNHGLVTGDPLPEQEVREMVRIAHGLGMAVMSHTNGVYGVRAALLAGVDSLEHGNFMDADTVRMLSDSRTVWVPTLVTVRNLIGCGRYDDEVLKPICHQAAENLTLAYQSGARVAPGSDAGAYMVRHGQGTEDEYRAFTEILGDRLSVKKWIADGEAEIKRRFRRNS